MDLLTIGGLACAVGTYLIGGKLQERRIDKAVDEKLKERDSKEDGDD